MKLAVYNPILDTFSVIDNGITPHIDPITKHWMLGDVDTGVQASGTANYDELSNKPVLQIAGDTDVPVVLSNLASGLYKISGTYKINTTTTFSYTAKHLLCFIDAEEEKIFMLSATGGNILSFTDPEITEDNSITTQKDVEEKSVESATDDDIDDLFDSSLVDDDERMEDATIDDIDSMFDF